MCNAGTLPIFNFISDILINLVLFCLHVIVSFRKKMKHSFKLLVMLVSH